MSEVTSSNLLNGGLYWENGPQQNSGNEVTKSLDQDDFLMLLTKELEYQDPFEPVDNSQMVSQMADMSTLESLDGVNASMADLSTAMSSSQALQASSLVGKQVLLPTGTSYLEDGGTMGGKVSLPVATDNVVMRITNEAGETVRSVDMGSQAPGNIDLEWDGLNDDGEPMPAGNYNFVVSGMAGGQNQEFTVGTYNRVSSVVLPGGSVSETLLNVPGLGTVSLNDAVEVKG